MNAFIVVVIAKSRRGRKVSAHTHTHTYIMIDREDDHSGLESENAKIKLVSL